MTDNLCIFSWQAPEMGPSLICYRSEFLLLREVWEDNQILAKINCKHFLFEDNIIDFSTYLQQRLICWQSWSDLNTAELDPSSPQLPSCPGALESFNLSSSEARLDSEGSLVTRSYRNFSRPLGQFCAHWDSGGHLLAVICSPCSDTEVRYTSGST